MKISNKFKDSISAILAVATSLLVSSELLSQEPLRWKFQEGQKLDYNMVQDMNIGTVGGPLGNQNVSMQQQMEMTWNVVGIDANGEALIKQKFDRVSMKMTLPGIGAMEYDSKSNEPPVGPAAMLAPMYKALTEAEFELVMTTRGEIKDVKIPEQLLAALKNSPGAAAMGDLATPEGFKKMISQGALVLPENAPKQGEEWTSKVELNVPMGGKQVIETTYHYDGTKDVDGVQFAVFRPTLKMTFEGDNQPKIKEQDSSGEILFNVEAGRLDSSELKQVVSMEQAAGIQTKIDQKINVKVTPSDEAVEESGTTN